MMPECGYEAAGGSAARPSLVHTEETTVDIFAGGDYRAWVFGNFPDLMPVTEAAILAYDNAYYTHYADGLAKCRTNAWYSQSIDTGLVDILSNSCRQRWCPACAEARARTIAHGCLDFFSKQSAVRSLTLTQKHSDLPFDVQRKKLYKAFRKLRSSKFFRGKVTGGVWYFQTKRMSSGGRWHNHLHCLITGSFIPQDWLSQKWLKITGDSSVVDIRSVDMSGDKLARAVSDIVRYSGRPANLRDIPADCRLELMYALDGVRVVGKWGKCRAIELAPPHYKEGGGRISLGSVPAVHEMLESGDERARQIVFAYQHGTPLRANVSLADGIVTFSRPPPDNAILWGDNWN